ncbi:MAG: glycosyltransferase family 2 protein [Burkholderiales bacterium]|nr:glycosyltransferase family 2 protein [Burkholderiales bacterium]
MRGPLLSIVTPAYAEAGNLEALHARLTAVLRAAGEGGTAVDWEWLVIDDHSPDDTFAVIERLAAADARVRGLRLSRNEGSHRAILCGLQHARGAAAVVLAADLQDPPELIAHLLAPWHAGAQIVHGVRRTHPGRSAFERLSGTLFHRLTRRLTGIRSLPATGADCFLLDRVVIDALAAFSERNVNLCVLLAWLGFREAHVTYDKAPRRAGRSGWTLAKRVTLFVDTVVAFSHAPLRAMSVLGACTAVAGFAFALYVAALALLGQPPLGWASLMVAVLVLGGLQMLMLGVLGEYVWRALDEARRRPRALVESATRPAGVADVGADAGADAGVGAGVGPGTRAAAVHAVAELRRGSSEAPALVVIAPRRAP